MIRLYGMPLSTFCAKVQVVLRHKDIAFEDCRPPDGYGSAAYRAIVPMGTIPALVDGQLVLCETEAIGESLDEQHREPPMLFGDAAQRAHIRSLSRIHDCWVEPQLRALYPHADPARREASAVEQHVGQFHRRLEEMGRYATPSPYIAGDALSIADCAWATTLVQAELMFAALGGQLSVPESLGAWRAALARHPAIAPGVAACSEAMTAWLQAKGAG